MEPYPAMRIELAAQLEEENGKLKKIVADLSLDKAMLQDGSAESFEACPTAAKVDYVDLVG
jgi:hypothetical protein